MTKKKKSTTTELQGTKDICISAITSSEFSITLMFKNKPAMNEST